MINRRLESDLGFHFGEIERKKDELRKKFVGIEELEIRLQEFKAQPWPFLIYLVHWHPAKFTDVVHSYESYDGAINSKVVMEKIRDYYVMSSLYSELIEDKETRKVV